MQTYENMHTLLFYVVHDASLLSFRLYLKGPFSLCQTKGSGFLQTLLQKSDYWQSLEESEALQLTHKREGLL